MRSIQTICPNFSIGTPKPTRKVLNVDIEGVAIALIAVHAAIIGLKLRDKLALIPTSMFDLSILDRILAYAWVLRFIATMRRTETATAERKLISPALAAKAEPVKARMLKVVKHILGDRAEYTQEIASIEEGRGFEGTAHNLMRLSLSYNTEAALISRDPVHYVATDASDAATYYDQILAELAEESVPEWSKIALKAFSVIEREYARLRGTVQWAWHDDPDVQAAVPTLFPRGGVAARGAEDEVAENAAPTPAPVVTPPVAAAASTDTASDDDPA